MHLAHFEHMGAKSECFGAGSTSHQLIRKTEMSAGDVPPTQISDTEDVLETFVLLSIILVSFDCICEV